MNIKQCSSCKKIKPITEFNKKSRNKDGLTCQCKKCISEYKKIYYTKNREKVLIDVKNYAEANSKKIKVYRAKYYAKTAEKSREYSRNYHHQHREEIKEYKKSYKSRRNELRNKRRKEDPNFKLSEILRSRIQKATKRYQKSGSAIKDLGCSIYFLIAFLEEQFYPHPRTGDMMNWKNHSYKGWHIDHIIPLSSFDLTNPEEFKKACHYTNLQPLWAEENIKKSNKILI